MEVATEYQEAKTDFQAWDESQALGEASMKARILKGEICPYCGGTPVKVDSAEFYHGVDYGSVMACRPCQAWVGFHQRKGGAPLGRLADARLRDAKKKAHAAFDRIWGKWHKLRGNARWAGYQWLARHMNLPEVECHIGMFDLDQCRAVVEICFTPNAQFDFDQFLEGFS